MKNLYKFKKSCVLLMMMAVGLTVLGQTLTTDWIINITSSTARCGYTVIDGGTNATGVCLGTSLNPVVNGPGVITFPGTTGTGSKEDSLFGLSSSTVYHARAYATNDGTNYAYGVDIQFQTYGTGTGSYPYQCILLNDYLSNTTTEQFDVYIYSTDAGNQLYLNNYQLGFEVHNVGTTAGTLTGIFIGSSDLPVSFQPATNIIFRADGNHFDFVIPGPAPSTSGILIPYSASGPGTRIGTFQLVHHDVSGGPATAFPTGVQLNILADFDVLGKTVIYAVAGGSGTPVNNTSQSSHSPREPVTNNNFYPSNNYSCNAANWEGTTTTDWSTSSNWFANPSTITTPPSSSTYSYVPSYGITNYPSVGTRTTPTCGALTIGDGGYITVASNGDLTINGNLTLGTTTGGPMRVKSDATGTGSLITLGTITGSGVATAKVERYIAANAWHLISAPISDGLSGIFIDQYLRPYDEPNNAWGSYIISLTTALTAGQGFVCWPVTSQAYTFTGTLNTGTVTPGVAYAGATRGNNLVGNPYPSAIDWEATIGWTKTNIGPSIWIWNQSAPVGSSGNVAGNFGVWDGFTGTNGVTKYIPVGQGFFVKAIGSPTLSMTNDVRVHNSQAFLKKSDLPNAIRLHAQNYYGSDEIVVYFDAKSSWIYDPQIDSHKMFGDVYAPQMYSFKPGDSEELSINVLPEIKNPLVVPVWLEIGVNGEYSITASQIQSFASNVSLYLEDLKLGKVQDLRINPVYTFVGETSDTAHRFNLHFSNFPYGIPGPASDDALQIYSFGQSLYVKSNTVLNEYARIFVYDALGHTAHQSSFGVISLTKFDLNLVHGYYTVKVLANSGVYTQKVFIN